MKKPKTKTTRQIVDEYWKRQDDPKTPAQILTECRTPDDNRTDSQIIEEYLSSLEKPKTISQIVDEYWETHPKPQIPEEPKVEEEPQIPEEPKVEEEPQTPEETQVSDQVPEEEPVLNSSHQLQPPLIPLSPIAIYPVLLLPNRNL